MTAPTVVVVGSSGYVGRATLNAFRGLDTQVRAMSAPRLHTIPEFQLLGSYDSTQGAAIDHLRRTRAVQTLAERFKGADAVVNAAGVPRATGRTTQMMTLANGYLPAVLAIAAEQAGVSRFVHVSSAAVQGNVRILDETAHHAPFSPYSHSKALGESLLLATPLGLEIVIFRPPAVHGIGRDVSIQLARLARSQFATVARPGIQPTAQALIDNVANAIATLAVCPTQPPRIVIHPSEGVTVQTLMHSLGGKAPHAISPKLARVLIRGAYLAGRVVPPWTGIARRLETLWFGQLQATSWLTKQGWTPKYGENEWRQLGQAARRHRERQRRDHNAD